MSNLLNPWSIRTLKAFKFVQEFEFRPVLAFKNNLLVVGIPEPVYWVANNDNVVK